MAFFHGIFLPFLDIFLLFVIFWIFWIFLDFFILLDFLIFLIFFCFFGFFLFCSKLLRLLINVTEVTTEHQKWLKISTKDVKGPKGKKSLGLSRRPPQELEVSPRSELYLLVRIKIKLLFFVRLNGIFKQWK